MRLKPLIQTLLFMIIALGAVTSLAQFNFRWSDWPLETLANFTPQFLVGGVIVSLIAAVKMPKLAAISAIAVMAMGFPLWGFQNFQKPSRAPCPDDTCLTVLSVNNWGDSGALRNLAVIADEQQADVIGIYELPFKATEDSLQILFPHYQSIILASTEAYGQPIPKPMALLSRQKLDNAQIKQPKGGGDRVIITAQLPTASGPIDLILAHPKAPISQSDMRKRNTLLAAAASAARESDTFILMGDFNLTPWVPTYRDLPGRRAGDPRFQATWSKGMPLLGLPIDHILFDGALQLHDAQVLPDFGSDHRPVLARFAPSPAQ